MGGIAIPLILAILLALPAAASDKQRVVLETTQGDITLELLPAQAPLTVDQFRMLVDRKAYDGTIFHRVIMGFMIQAGGYRTDLSALDEIEPVRNEADRSLPNNKWTVALARQDTIDSGSRQFFINLRDNPHLDHSADSCTREEEAAAIARQARGLIKPMTCESFGYTVFARVVDGFDVVEDIEFVATEYTEEFEDLPVEPVVIHALRWEGQGAAPTEQ